MMRFYEDFGLRRALTVHENPALVMSGHLRDISLEAAEVVIFVSHTSRFSPAIDASCSAVNAARHKLICGHARTSRPS